MPTLEDVATLMRLLPRSATGQSISNYVDVLTGPKGAGEFHGAEHMYFILVDSGRTGGARQRGARGAALHPLRRLHEPLPGVPERRRPLLRLGLPGADRLDPDADVRRARERAGPAGGLDDVQPVRRRLPGAHPAARPAAQAARAGVRAAACARGTSASACALWAWVAQRPALYALATRIAVRVLKAMGGREGLIHRLPVGGGLDRRAATCRRRPAGRSASSTARAAAPGHPPGGRHERHR